MDFFDKAIYHSLEMHEYSSIPHHNLTILMSWIKDDCGLQKLQMALKIWGQYV